MRRVRAVLLCEDLQHAVLVRRFFEKRGWDRRWWRVEMAPPGHGSAERFVRERYPLELASLRKFGGHGAALVVMIDGDNKGLRGRHKAYMMRARRPVWILADQASAFWFLSRLGPSRPGSLTLMEMMWTNRRATIRAWPGKASASGMWMPWWTCAASRRCARRHPPLCWLLARNTNGWRGENGRFGRAASGAVAGCGFGRFGPRRLARRWRGPALGRSCRRRFEPRRSWPSR